MIQKEHIETILKINGLEVSAPDEQIRTVLLSANFDTEEAQTAISLLRQKDAVNHTRIDGLHKVFRSDGQLKPSEISALLGIDVDVPKHIVRDRKAQQLTAFHFSIIFFFAILIAVIGMFGYMYYFEIGPFHSSVSILDRLR